MGISESPIDERYRLRLFDYYLQDPLYVTEVQSGKLYVPFVLLSPVKTTRRSIVRQHFFGIALRTLGCSPALERSLPSVVQ